MGDDAINETAIIARLREAVPERCQPCERATFMVAMQRLRVMNGVVSLEEACEIVPKGFVDCPDVIRYIGDIGGVACNSGGNSWSN